MINTENNKFMKITISKTEYEYLIKLCKIFNKKYNKTKNKKLCPSKLVRNIIQDKIIELDTNILYFSSKYPNIDIENYIFQLLGGK